MSAEEYKAIVRRVYEELLNKRKLAAADELYAPDYVWRAPGGEEYDREGTKEHMTDVFRAFPDIHWTVEDLVAERDKVMARFTARGTHQAEYAGIAPTGKQVTVTGITISRIQDGKIMEDWEELDRLGMMQQLAAIPQMA